MLIEQDYERNAAAANNYEFEQANSGFTKMTDVDSIAQSSFAIDDKDSNSVVRRPLATRRSQGKKIIIC